MLVRILPKQLKEHWTMINDAIDATFPDTASKVKTPLLRDLMLESAIAWVYLSEDNIIKAVFISRINDDYAVGRKTLTIVAAHGLERLSPDVFIAGFKTAQAYARGKDCEFMDFYTDNEAIMKYAKMFDIAWQSTYVQIKL